MTKREKIIISIMVVAIIAAAYELFFSNTKTETIKQKTDSRQLIQYVAKVVSTLKKDTSRPVSLYIKNAAEKSWQADPFLKSITDEKHKSLLQEPLVDKEEEDLNLIYSGYIKIGQRLLAIINGMEYENGDQPDRGGYTVRSISPKRVIIFLQKKNREVILPIQETY